MRVSYRRKAGEPLIENHPAERFTFPLNISAESGLLDDLKTVLEGLQENPIRKNLAEALDRLGLDVTMDDEIDVYSKLNCVSYMVSYPPNVEANPSRQQDVFSLVRQLDNLLTELKREISVINDPSRQTAAIATVSAYISSYQNFLGVNEAVQPNEIPQGLRKGLLSRLVETDWLQISDRAVKLAGDVLALMKLVT